MDDIELTNQLLSALTGHHLLAFRMGIGVRLEFDDDAYHELTIEGELRFPQPDGSQLRGDPIGLTVAEQLIRVLGTTVTAASVDRDGDLTIAFGDDSLIVPCSDMYESWQLKSDAELLIVSMPGGGLAIWQPDGQSYP